MSAEAEQLMKEAWRDRRESFEFEGAEKTRLLEGARQKLNQAIGLADAPDLRAQATHLLANVEQDSGNDDEALRLWESSVLAFRDIGDPAHLAHKTRHLAMAYQRAGRLEEAAVCYESSISLYREDEEASPQDHANAALAYSRYCVESGRVDDARLLLLEAKRCYQDAGFQDGVTYCEEQLTALAKEGHS